LFANGCFLIPTTENITKGEFFSSLGGGLRTRNESLIFGTMELRLNYFPRINFGMQEFRIDFKTDLRFKYNSQYIKRPDFVWQMGSILFTPSLHQIKGMPDKLFKLVGRK